jgi:hypothetical protein
MPRPCRWLREREALLQAIVNEIKAAPHTSGNLAVAAEIRG